MKFPSSKLVTVKEVSVLLGVTTAAVYKWVKDDEIPAPLRIGGPRGILRWHPEILNAWLEERSHDTQ
jgi:excisionase family DNA binding protein